MIQKEDIEIILPSHGWTQEYIKQLGCRVVDPYYGQNIVMRILRELLFRIKFPYRSIFYNKNAICCYKTIVVYESLITSDYIEWLHKSCPKCKIIIFYTNKVGASVNPNHIGSWCEKWTSDKDDAKKYNMHLFEGGGYFRQWRVNKTTPVYDVFYIGKDKNRLARLRKIESEMNKHGIKTLFYITWERSWQKKDDGIHQPFLPYERVLDYIGKSKAILHLLEGAQNGITIRIQESLIHKVKLITDDINIVKYDFYSPDNIFVLGRDDMNGLKDFLNAPYEDVTSDFFKHAYYDQMIDEIVGGSYRNSTLGTRD